MSGFLTKLLAGREKPAMKPTLDDKGGAGRGDKRDSSGDSEDAAYLEAVYRSDAKKCLRMVRKEAMKRMKRPILDKDGLPKVFYNGTASGFRGTELERWLWLTDDFNVALGYTIGDPDSEYQYEKKENVTMFFVDAADAVEVDVGHQDWDKIKAGDGSERIVESTDSIASDAFAKGASMAIIRNVNDGHDVDHSSSSQTVVCVFDRRLVNGKKVPNNVVKLANEVNFDERTDDYFIPLSKRFDGKNPDIRY